MVVPDRRQSDSEEGISYDFPIYLTPEDRAHLRLLVGPRGKLLDFAIMQDILIAGDWMPVVRFDCHENFHVHRFRIGGVESRTVLGDRNDLDQKFDTAVADMLQHWEENRRRYLDG